MIPHLPAYQIGLDVVAWCRPCNTWHWHRLPGCPTQGMMFHAPAGCPSHVLITGRPVRWISDYSATGYILEVQGQSKRVTREAMKALARTPLRVVHYVTNPSDGSNL